MKLRLLVLSILSILFLVSCGDNLFEKSSDKKKEESKEAKLEELLNDRKYDEIISDLDAGALHSLSSREIYILQMAYMGRAGFAASRNLDKIFDNKGGNMGVMILMQDNFSAYDINALDYKKAMNICTTAGINPDSDMVTACGLSAIMHSMLGIGEAVASAGVSDKCSVSSFSECDSNDITLMTNYLNTTPSVKALIDEIRIPANILLIENTALNFTGKDVDKNFRDTVKNAADVLGSPTCQLDDILTYMNTGYKPACGG